MQISPEVAELLREGLSNREVARRSGIHVVKVAGIRSALGLPSHYQMLPVYVAPDSHRAHGTRAKYAMEQCRCRACRDANTEDHNQRTRLLAYGRWHPWVDAEPVRAHIRYLQSCGMGLRSIGAVCGVDRKSLQSILNGRPDIGRPPQREMRPARAARILAVEPTLENLGASTIIGGVGTVRRLQALVAAGWPVMHLGKHMGWTTTNLCALVTADTASVKTVLLVRRVYGELWNVDPLTRGVTPSGVTRSKRRADHERWAPPAAWDDDQIDDPQAFPDWTGHCGTTQGYNLHSNHGIPLCVPCRSARSAYRRDMRAKSALLTPA